MEPPVILILIGSLPNARTIAFVSQIYIAQAVLKDCAAELKFLGRDVAQLEKITGPFPRMSYDDAAKYLIDLYEKETDPEKKELLKFEWGMDFGAPHETEITKLYDKPVFVYGYPSAVNAFYMEPWPGRPEVCKSVDLLAPEGYGEICGGSERMSDPDKLLARIQKDGLPEESFKWYLELRKYGSVPHSGFGMADANWPAGTLLGFDNHYAIHRVTSTSLAYQAAEAYAMRRSTKFRVDVGQIAYRLFEDAWDALTLVVTAHPWPGLRIWPDFTQRITL